jgi:hypothetical protein
MTPTTRWTVAQRRKRLIISQTVRERSRHDPRRASVDPAALVPAAAPQR